jgi:phosphatidylserine/phosphatidylglycerophosphate/cardiolipin synthase-like enzyme
MARKKSTKKSSSSSSITLGGLVVVVALIIVVGVLYGPERALYLLGDTLGVDLGGEGAPSGAEVVESTGGSGDFYTVYFTDPVIPFDDVTTGGTEEHLIELINSAQSSIDAAMFEFNLQNVADALIAAHNRGVTVRIVYDDEHTEEDPQMEELIDAGIPATPDERSAFMHNKFYVFDRQMVWTGSMNITVNGVYRNNNNVIVIRSTKLAENYTVEFEEMFNGEFGPSSPSNTPNPVFTLDGVQIENYFAPEDDVITALINNVSQAQSTIHFMAFSFTDDALGQAIRERAEQGVEVAGIFEQRGAATEYSECGAMLNMRLDVRLDGNPRTFHHKVIIIDGSTVITGSFNFSENATESNDENVVIVHDPGVAGLYEQEFAARMAEAQLTMEGVCEAAD